MQFTNAAAEVDPQDLYYTHSKIRPVFSKNGKRIVDTIAEIESGDMLLDELPPVTVVIGAGGHKFCLDNRRLYVLKELRRKGLLPKNQVTVLMRKAPPRDMIKYTTEKCSLNGTIMREKGHDGGGDIEEEQEAAQNHETQEWNDTASVTSGTANAEIREKYDKKKYKVGNDHVESEEDRFLRQKRIIAEKQLEFQRQAAERQRQRQLEKEAAEQKIMSKGHRNAVECTDDDDSSDDDCDSADESIEEVFVCEVCRKEFKSEQQVEQHFITKSHKNKIKEAKKKKGLKFAGKGDEVKIITRPKKRKQPRPPPTLPPPPKELSLDDVEVVETSLGDFESKNDMICSAEEVEDIADEDSDEVDVESDDQSDSVMSDTTNKVVDEIPISSAVTVVRKSDPVNDALMLLLIQKRISQLEMENVESNTLAIDEKQKASEDDEDLSHQTRMTAGTQESRDLIAELERQNSDARYNQQLTKSFQHEGVGSKALPSQYVHKQGAAFDSRMAENRHHTGSHYVMAGGVQFQRGVRVKGVVSRHSKQAAVRNGPVGGGAQNMKRMGLLNEQRETGGKKGSGTSGGKKSKKKCRKNPSDT